MSDRENLKWNPVLILSECKNTITTAKRYILERNFERDMESCDKIIACFKKLRTMLNMDGGSIDIAKCICSEHIIAFLCSQSPLFVGHNFLIEVIFSCILPLMRLPATREETLFEIANNSGMIMCLLIAKSSTNMDVKIELVEVMACIIEYVQGSTISDSIDEITLVQQMLLNGAAFNLCKLLCQFQDHQLVIGVVNCMRCMKYLACKTPSEMSLKLASFEGWKPVACLFQFVNGSSNLLSQIQAVSLILELVGRNLEVARKVTVISGWNDIEFLIRDHSGMLDLTDNMLKKCSDYLKDRCQKFVHLALDREYEHRKSLSASSAASIVRHLTVDPLPTSESSPNKSRSPTSYRMKNHNNNKASQRDPYYDYEREGNPQHDETPISRPLSPLSTSKDMNIQFRLQGIGNAYGVTVSPKAVRNAGLTNTSSPTPISPTSREKLTPLNQLPLVQRMSLSPYGKSVATPSFLSSSSSSSSIPIGKHEDTNHLFTNTSTSPLKRQGSASSFASSTSNSTSVSTSLNVSKRKEKVMMSMNSVDHHSSNRRGRTFSDEIRTMAAENRRKGVGDVVVVDPNLPLTYVAEKLFPDHHSTSSISPSVASQSSFTMWTMDQDSPVTGNSGACSGEVTYPTARSLVGFSRAFESTPFSSKYVLTAQDLLLEEAIPPISNLISSTVDPSDNLDGSTNPVLLLSSSSSSSSISPSSCHLADVPNEKNEDSLEFIHEKEALMMMASTQESRNENESSEVNSMILPISSNEMAILSSSPSISPTSPLRCNSSSLPKVSFVDKLQMLIEQVKDDSSSTFITSSSSLSSSSTVSVIE